ncbi:hypothetical protein MT1_2975 [Pseudomonas sp. MT-1]|nr:hypothetical protein MT1_2975 [Pseudomonas sp. MT-1]
MFVGVLMVIVESATKFKLNKLFFLYFLTLVLPFLFLYQKVAGFFLATILILGYLLLAFKRKLLVDDIVYVTILFFLVLPSLAFAQHGFSHYFYFILTALTFLAAKKAAETKTDNLVFCLKSSYWAFAIFSFAVYFVYRSQPEPFSELVQGASANGIPSYLIVLQVTYSLVSYVKYKRLPLFSALCTLLIAVLGVGRGSIYISVLIFLLSFVSNAFLDAQVRRYRSLIVLSIFGLIFLALFIYNFDELYTYIEGRTKALQGINDPHRARILIEYIFSISWWQIVVGGKYEGTVIQSTFGDNPHISYIRAHAYFGFYYTALVLVSPFLLLNYRAITGSLVFFSFTALLMLRALSEPILFPTVMDFFYYLILWVFLKKKSEIIMR